MPALRKAGPWPGWARAAGRKGWEARPQPSSGPGELGEAGIFGLALGVDGGWGCPVTNPRAGPRKPRACIGWWPRSLWAEWSACARGVVVPAGQQVNLKEGRKGRLPYQDCWPSLLCLSRATCPQELLGTVGRDFHSKPPLNLLETF